MRRHVICQLVRHPGAENDDTVHICIYVSVVQYIERRAFLFPYVSDNSYRKLTHAPPRLYYRSTLFTLSLNTVMADTVQASKPEEEEQEDEQEDESGDDGSSDGAEV